MRRFLRTLFPDRIFGGKLESDAETRLRLAKARAEEATVLTHVDNALMFVDTLAAELSFDRAIDAYIREMAIPEPLASSIATRALVVLGQELIPSRRRAVEAGVEEERPKLRLDDQLRQRTAKRA